MKPVFGILIFGVIFFHSIPEIPCQSQWDPDGGFTYDYEGIALLIPQKVGAFPGKSSYAPLSIQTIQPFMSTRNADKILVLVDSNVYSHIQNELNVYLSDLMGDGYFVGCFQVSGGDPITLKNFILTHSQGLLGCVFLGDLPAAWYELNGVLGHEEFPCDLYYMDLDGLWPDQDYDGIFDHHSAGSGDEGPEIFVGRIDASKMPGVETDHLKAYLNKNHLFRMGDLKASNYGLTYTEDTWIWNVNMRTAMENAYPNYDEIIAPDTKKGDYLKNRLPNPHYEFIQLSCHSTTLHHIFNRGGKASFNDIKATPPYAMFYNLFCCSSLRFTQKNFLGGSYLFNTSNTSLAVVGSTKTGSMLVFTPFYETFAHHCIGEAFRCWFNHLAPYGPFERVWHYGMTLAGDPCLKRSKPALIFSYPQGLPQCYVPPGPKIRLEVKITPGLQTYVSNTAFVYYRYDPNDPFTQVGLSPLGPDLFEAELPETRPNDRVEYYFSAQGDFGTTVCAPIHAPLDLYACDVFFIEPFMEDDFETDKGWQTTHKEVLSGEWERADPSQTPAQPEDDHSLKGGLCYVTGAKGGGISDFDLDGGPARLESPTLDLMGQDAVFSFYTWFYHSEDGDQQPLQIKISNNNGADWISVDSLSHDPYWRKRTYRVSDHTTPSSQIKIRIAPMDKPDDDVVEALIDDFVIGFINTSCSLWCDSYAISAAKGAVIKFSLDAGPNHGNGAYLLLGGMSGSTPGFKLPNGTHIPINWDFFTNAILNPSLASAFQNFMGQLDPWGVASAQFNTFGPLIDPSLIGLIADFVFLADWDFVSNNIKIKIEP